jgi:hypothetical protein
MHKKIYSLLLLVVLVAGATDAQTVQSPENNDVASAERNASSAEESTPVAGEEKLTRAEEKEVHELAGEFTRRLISDKDLNSVVDDLFVPDFIERYQKAERDGVAQGSAAVRLYLMGDVADQVVEESEPAALRKYFQAVTAFFGTMMVAYATRCEEQLDDDNDDACVKSRVLTPGVQLALNQSHVLKGWINADEEGDSVATVEELRDSTAAIERGLAQLREEQRDLDFAVVEQTAWFKKWTGNEVTEPDTSTLKADAFGYSAGTRMIRIFTHTGLTLTMVRMDGRLRILWAQFVDD